VDRDRAREHIDRPIRIRVRIYSLIFLVVAVIVVVETVGQGLRAVLPVLACAAGGLLVGIGASRMFHLSWDAVSKRVIGRLDVAGVVILVLYVLFSIFRTRIIDTWLDGPVVGVAGLAALAGVMAGQVVGTRRGLIRVFRMVRG
jgi:hypothetical protein